MEKKPITASISLAGRRLLTVREVGAFLGIRPKTIYIEWPSWVEKFGLHPVRINGNSRSKLRFWSDEIERMAQQWEVVQCR